MKNLASIKFLNTFPYLEELDNYGFLFKVGLCEDKLRNCKFIFANDNKEYFFKNIFIIVYNIKDYIYKMCVCISSNIFKDKIINYPYIEYDNLFYIFANSINCLTKEDRITYLIIK